MNKMQLQHQGIPYGRQRITEEDIEAVVAVLKSQYLTQGPVVPKFEKAIGQKVRSNHVIAVNSATSALHIACKALGLRKGDSLWTSPNTFVASANCGIYCDAKVNFVDIEPETGLMCTKELQIKLEEAKSQSCLPKIVMPVHLSGTSCNMREIRRLSEVYNFRIVEDASHAIGGKYMNKPVGNCEYSDITVFSLHPVKIITSGEGGVATTNSKKLAIRMKDLRSHGITKDRERFIDEDIGPWKYEQQNIGYNYRLSDIHAALGLSQLKRLDEIIKKREILFENYKKLLAGLPVKLLEIPTNVRSALHLAVIRLDKSNEINHRELFEFLRKENIGVQVHYTPVHLQPFYKRLGFREGDFPNAEKYAKSAISIPIYEDLTGDEQKIVVDTLKKGLCRK